MSIYQRILVPVDDSLAAHAGLRAAIDLALDQGATLKIITVVDEASEAFGGAELGWIDPQTMDASLKSGAEHVLDEAVKLATDAGLNPEHELITAPDGHVAQHIKQAAQSWDADLLVLGTHGRHGLSRWLSGSTTESILHGLTLPLLAVPAAQPAAATASAR